MILIFDIYLQTGYNEAQRKREVVIERYIFDIFGHKTQSFKVHNSLLKFIYSEKATKCCESFTLHLSYVVPVKSEVKISQNFVAFSEYMNFNLDFLKQSFVIL